jgi:hypothetical protein
MAAPRRPPIHIALSIVSVSACSQIPVSHPGSPSLSVETTVAPPPTPEPPPAPPSEGSLLSPVPYPCSPDPIRIQAEGVYFMQNPVYTTHGLDADDAPEGWPRNGPAARAAWVYVENCPDEPIEVTILRDATGAGGGKQLEFAPGSFIVPAHFARAARLVLHGEGKHGLVAEYKTAAGPARKTKIFTVRLRDSVHERAKAACVACRGDWGAHGIAGTESCYCRTEDAGRECRDGLACEGACVNPHWDVVTPERPTIRDASGRWHLGERETGILVGHCSEFSWTIGCVSFIPDGASAAGPQQFKVFPGRVCSD